MNRHILTTTVLSAALVLALGACRQEAAPMSDAAPAADVAATTAAAPAEPAKPAFTIPTGTYKMDPAHTMVLAQWNHLGFSNPTANFDDASGTITWNAENPTASSVNVTIPLSGLRAFSDNFNKHLSGADFFEVAKFPEATFKSTSVTSAGINKFTVVGDLTIKSITKPVTLDVTVNGAGEHPMAKVQAVGFDASGMVKRSDFGLEMATPMVGDDVNLRITTEALMEAPAGAAAAPAAAEAEAEAEAEAGAAQ